MNKAFKKFLEKKGISESDYKTKSAEELGQLHSDYLEERLKTLGESVEKASTSEKQTELEKEIKTLKENAEKYVKNEALTKMQKQLDEAQESIDQLKENGGVPGADGKLSIKAVLKAKVESITKLAKEKLGRVKFEVKARHNPTDIADRSDYAEFESGTNRKAFRKFTILQMFTRRPISSEFLKYREEDTVTRDGKVVVACAKSTHNTKKTWKIETVQVGKVRDMTDVCLDMIEDYDFVEGEIRELVEQGVTSKEEVEILTGTGDILSIESIASDFSAANALAPFNDSFDAPTLAELTAAMKAQIFTFGQENKWDANVILMNYNDKVKFMHQKNADNDYLLPNFVLSNGGVLNGMQVITSPLVAPNTLYVMDTTQAVILDRKTTEVEMFYENKDNAEHEVVTVKALKRMQLHVKKIDRDAFMKCTDISAALEEIAKPTTL